MCFHRFSYTEESCTTGKLLLRLKRKLNYLVSNLYALSRKICRLAVSMETEAKTNLSYDKPKKWKEQAADI
jgi:hypothetical protein